ncbi:phage antirepressor N-terminal domain-containing protein [Glutamicibacter sp. FBE19]|uniref:phage antirepressor N-terminal domain-containing protein n=1 Tax=Glutamicibacter sp. FBE19 TaxID=2761534 RepID=UPI00189688F4|nr:phage antirepressor N-terminal domain-containing protein [Glutamicibacter sp. FBE19]MBF6672426.1 phage antirepressor [Glutamicibacter sp. FBE19]
MTTLVEIPFKNTALYVTSEDGKPLVSLRHMCESIGLDVESQRKRINRSAWGRAVMMTATGSDGKNYQMTMIDRRVMTIWLATVETSRIKDVEVRQRLEAFQNEAADALDSYFHEGGAINPNATASQLDRIALTVKAQGEALQALSPFLSPKFLESKAKLLVARALGEEPEIDPLDLPLHADDYLTSKGLKASEIKSERSMFGRRMAKAYRELHGKAPKKATNEVNGSIRKINAYTNRDRGLFDQVWDDHYAELFEPSLMDELS